MQDIALWKILSFAKYGAGQDIELGEIWHWARYGSEQDIALGKIWPWARYGIEQNMALSKICAGQDMALGKILLCWASGCAEQKIDL